MSELVPPLSDLAEQINAAHAEVLAAVRTSLLHARTAGDLLLQAKARCQHGQWLPWLAGNVQFSERTAQAYMRVAKRWIAEHPLPLPADVVAAAGPGSAACAGRMERATELQSEVPKC
jgi:hypothetical protein